MALLSFVAMVMKSHSTGLTMEMRTAKMAVMSLKTLTVMELSTTGLTAWMEQIFLWNSSMMVLMIVLMVKMKVAMICPLKNSWK